MTEIKLVKSRLEEKSKVQKAHKQMMKMLIGTSILIFITLLLVWLIQSSPETEIPTVYLYSSLIIIISSLIVHLAKKAIGTDEIENAIILISVAIIMGSLFMVSQYQGWTQLVELSQQFKNILLPFTIIHFVHTMIGLIFLILVFFRLKTYRIHSRAIGISSNVFYFWHFLGIVWLSFIGILA